MLFRPTSVSGGGFSMNQRFTVLSITLALCACVIPIALFSPALAATTFYSNDLESDVSDWSTTGQWHVTTDRSSSPTHSFYFGMENGNGTADNSYDTGTVASGQLTSPSILLPSTLNVTLRFWSFWGGEGGSFEHPIVRVIHGNGSTLAYEDTGGAGSGNVSVSLSQYSGQTVQLAFIWDTVDSGINDFEGWYVDDVTITDEATPDAPTGDIVAYYAYVAASSPWIAGDSLAFGAEAFRENVAAFGSILVAFVVDEQFIGAVESSSPFSYIDVLSPSWTATAGQHNLTVIFDADNRYAETSEGNNIVRVNFYVFAGVVDLGVKIDAVEKVALQTDNGEVRPNPTERVIVHYTACNTGTMATVSPSISFTTTASAPVAGTTTSQPGVNFNLASLDVGACRSGTAQWDLTTTVGDVTIRAHVNDYPEKNTTTNDDSAKTFVLVGGMGGVAAPVQA